MRFGRIAIPRSYDPKGPAPREYPVWVNPAEMRQFLAISGRMAPARGPGGLPAFPPAGGFSGVGSGKVGGGNVNSKSPSTGNQSSGAAKSAGAVSAAARNSSVASAAKSNVGAGSAARSNNNPSSPGLSTPNRSSNVSSATRSNNNNSPSMGTRGGVQSAAARSNVSSGMSSAARGGGGGLAGGGLASLGSRVGPAGGGGPTALGGAARSNSFGRIGSGSNVSMASRGGVNASRGNVSTGSLFGGSGASSLAGGPGMGIGGYGPGGSFNDPGVAAVPGGMVARGQTPRFNFVGGAKAFGGTNPLGGVTTAAVGNAIALSNHLRNDLGIMTPINITSAFRSQKRQDKLRRDNPKSAALGNIAKNSRHTAGDALDISVPGMSRADLARAAKAVGGYGTIMGYKDSPHLHVDMRPGNLRAIGPASGGLSMAQALADARDMAGLADATPTVSPSLPTPKARPAMPAYAKAAYAADAAREAQQAAPSVGPGPNAMTAANWASRIAPGYPAAMVPDKITQAKYAKEMAAKGIPTNVSSLQRNAKTGQVGATFSAPEMAGLGNLDQAMASLSQPAAPAAHIPARSMALRGAPKASPQVASNAPANTGSNWNDGSDWNAVPGNLSTLTGPGHIPGLSMGQRGAPQAITQSPQVAARSVPSASANSLGPATYGPPQVNRAAMSSAGLPPEGLTAREHAIIAASQARSPRAAAFQAPAEIRQAPQMPSTSATVTTPTGPDDMMGASQAEINAARNMAYSRLQPPSHGQPRQQAPQVQQATAAPAPDRPNAINAMMVGRLNAQKASILSKARDLERDREAKQTSEPQVADRGGFVPQEQPRDVQSGRYTKATVAARRKATEAKLQREQQGRVSIAGKTRGGNDPKITPRRTRQLIAALTQSPDSPYFGFRWDQGLNVPIGQMKV